MVVSNSLKEDSNSDTRTQLFLSELPLQHYACTSRQSVNIDYGNEGKNSKPSVKYAQKERLATGEAKKSEAI